MLIQTAALIGLYGVDGHRYALTGPLWAALGALTFAAFCIAYALLIKGAITEPSAPVFRDRDDARTAAMPALSA